MEYTVNTGLLCGCIPAYFNEIDDIMKYPEKVRKRFGALPNTPSVFGATFKLKESASERTSSLVGCGQNQALGANASHLVTHNFSLRTRAIRKKKIFSIILT
jgi:hypothetical protein